MSETIEIKDAIYTPPSQTINNVQIRMFDYKIGVQARFHVSLMEDETTVHNELLVLTGAEFEAWGADDAYVSNWVLEKLGYTRK